MRRRDKPIVEGLNKTSGTENLSLLICNNCSSSSTTTTSFTFPFPLRSIKTFDSSIFISSSSLLLLTGGERGEGGGVKPVEGILK